MNNRNHQRHRTLAVTVSSLLGSGAIALAMVAPSLSQTPPSYPPTPVTPGYPSAPSMPGYPPMPSMPGSSPTGTITPIPGGQGTITRLPNLAALVTQWGMPPVECKVGVVTIRMADSVVCVNPSARLPGGEYTYDPATNQLAPFKVSAPFTFRSSFEYANCVEDILQLYQNRELFQQQGRKSTCMEQRMQAYIMSGLSSSDATKMLQEANFYSTSLLSSRLYPPRGQRMRIAKLFGFTYDIDANDPEIRAAASEAGLIVK